MAASQGGGSTGDKHSASRREGDKTPGRVVDDDDDDDDDDDAAVRSERFKSVKYRREEVAEVRRASRALVPASILSLLCGRGHSFKLRKTITRQTSHVTRHTSHVTTGATCGRSRRS
jgi:hypothetical protein